MTRTGSDPKFDNLAYLKKIEEQTLQTLQSMGINLDD